MVKNLKKLRQQRGISQQTLASVLGVSQQSINKYENHSVEPDIATLIALADFFGTSIDHLVGRDKAAFSADEQSMLAGYRHLRPAERVCVDTLIRTYRELAKQDHSCDSCPADGNKK